MPASHSPLWKNVNTVSRHHLIKLPSREIFRFSVKHCRWKKLNRMEVFFYFTLLDYKLVCLSRDTILSVVNSDVYFLASSTTITRI